MYVCVTLDGILFYTLGFFSTVWIHYLQLYYLLYLPYITVVLFATLPYPTLLNMTTNIISLGVLQRPAKDYDATNEAIRQGQPIIGKEIENSSEIDVDDKTSSPVIEKEDKNGLI